MLCSWWRYFATAVGVAALSGSLAVASMAQTSQDKTQWSFLGLGYETTPSVSVSMGSPKLDSGFFSADAFVNDECPIPSFVTPDQSGGGSRRCCAMYTVRKSLTWSSAGT